MIVLCDLPLFELCDELLALQTARRLDAVGKRMCGKPRGTQPGQIQRFAMNALLLSVAILHAASTSMAKYGLLLRIGISVGLVDCDVVRCCSRVFHVAVAALVTSSALCTQSTLLYRLIMPQLFRGR